MVMKIIRFPAKNLDKDSLEALVDHFRTNVTERVLAYADTEDQKAVVHLAQNYLDVVKNVIPEVVRVINEVRWQWPEQ